MSFAITVLPAVAGHRWVCVEGPVDASSAADLRSVVGSALAMPTRRLTIDLRQGRVDETGRAVLAEVTSAAAALGVDVRLLEPVATAPAGGTAAQVSRLPLREPVAALAAS